MSGPPSLTVSNTSLARLTLKPVDKIALAAVTIFGRLCSSHVIGLFVSFLLLRDSGESFLSILIQI